MYHLILMSVFFLCGSRDALRSRSDDNVPPASQIPGTAGHTRKPILSWLVCRQSHPLLFISVAVTTQHVHSYISVVNFAAISPAILPRTYSDTINAFWRWPRTDSSLFRVFGFFRSLLFRTAFHKNSDASETIVGSRRSHSLVMNSNRGRYI